MSELGAHLPYLDRVVGLTHLPEPSATEVLGYHGTSVQALEYVAQNGSFPTTGALGTEFYFAPITAGRQECDAVDPQEAKNEAIIWGELNARTRFILTHLNRDYSSPAAASEHANALWKAIIYPYFCDTDVNIDSLADIRGYGQDILDVIGLPDKQALELYQAAKACKGVLLTLSLDALNEFEFAGGDGPGAFDNSFDTPNGFPLEYVSRIEIPDGYERTYFQQLVNSSNA